MIEAVTRLCRWLPALLIASATWLVTVAGAQTPPAAPQPSAANRRVWTIISASGTQPLPVSVINGREYVSSADISGAFGLVLREDRAGGLVITMGGRSVVVSLTADGIHRYV